MVLRMQESFTAMERCPQPVIVACHSAVVGGGMDLITAADIRLCSKDAWFCVKEVDIGKLSLSLAFNGWLFCNKRKDENAVHSGLRSQF